MFHKVIKILTLLIMILYACSSMAREKTEPSIPAQPHLEKVSLQLDWKYQFEFAGFIVAKEKGFYADAGLDVTLLEYQPGVDTVADVLSGKTNYGIYNSSLVVSKRKVVPTLLMATYFQRSPLVFVTTPDIKNPIDLVGKKIMMTTDEHKYSSLALLLDHFSVNKHNSTFVEHNFNIQDFISGKVDAMSAFTSNQIYDLDQQQIDYNVIKPADYGFYMSAVNLFSSQEEAYHHTERSQRFLAASNRGWAYALDHQDEVIQLIHDKYSHSRTIAALTFEANVIQELFQRNLYPIGAVSKELSTRTYKQLIMHNMVDDVRPLLPPTLEDVVKAKSGELDLTLEERRYLQAKGKITMGVDPSWMPFEKIDNGKHYGIAADYMKLFQKKLPVPIEMVETKSWKETIDCAKQRKCDIFSLAASTPSRLEYMDFTAPYLSVPVVIATTMDKIYINRIESILNKKIGIVRGYAMAEDMRRKFPTSNIVDVDSIEDGLRKVESGELFCYIDNLMVIADQIQKNFTGSIKVSGRLDEGVNQVNLAVGTRNDEPLLHAIFAKLVNSITPDERKAILDRWTPITHEKQLDYELLWTLFGIMLLVSALYMYHYRQLRKYNELLLKLSETDKLTGLYNRSKLDELLQEKYELFMRYETNCGVAVLDIDHFKRINDTFGHQTGDSVLIEFSHLLTKIIRSTDIIGRWGGEEFLIIAPHSDIQETAQLAEKLLDQLRKHDFTSVGKVAASCGVSSFRQGGDIQNTVRLADEALYQAKDGGRNRVVKAQLNPQ